MNSFVVLMTINFGSYIDFCTDCSTLFKCYLRLLTPEWCLVKSRAVGSAREDQ